jgi:uncharacterized phiE125 gp8 family phage protein
MGLYKTSTTTTPSAFVTLLKAHLRVTGSSEDDLIQTYLEAALDDAERYTGRALLTTSYKWTLPHFPGTSELVIPRAPVSSGITSIRYYDTDGNIQTLSTDDFTSSIFDDLRATVNLLDTADWPDTDEDHPDAVEITFTAGYGAAHTALPKLLLSGILLYAGQLYDNRAIDWKSNTHWTDILRSRFFGPFRASWYSLDPTT